MRRFTTAAVIALLLLSVSAFPQATRKKRVAIMSFDYGTVHSSVAAIFGSDQDVGKGISDLLIQKLVNDGDYSVIERAQLDKIMAEQNFSNSDRADPNSAAKIGRLLGVDAIITGSITQFGRDDQHTNVGGGGYGGITGRYGIGGVGTHSAKAVVGITARLVDVNTAEILAACTGTGTSKRSGVSLLGAGGSGWNGGGGSLDMGSSNFGETILGEAVHQAVDSLGAQLDAKAGALPTNKVVVSGVVADVSGNSIIINVGSRQGIKVGDQLDVEHPTRTVKDPTTGKVLRTVSDHLGSATVTEVDEGSATLNFNGSGKPAVGDTVKSPQ
ncbi:curli production assembly/transport component CsgG [Candidatus Koribacter versatilis Ellin345]|uniref:Curli production assembly/transport component CsgG n=1 Tax=Koribacter versatilis (strain Ellin345) TaxID=204669 RepID=Q1IPN7_KORVE|nr:CsgG/HfaB family protein [Candidatus Koribacter versatilis]ABF41163.1 curli production assembly/transport component CsgG [Candidatus Koribacter versatilis Ellin345]